MRRTFKRILLMAGLLPVMMVSCVSPKHWTYLQDMEYGIDYAAKPAPELRLQPGDEVTIQVLSSNPELSAPFNPSVGITTSIDGVPKVTPISSPSYSYRIDSRGYIEFPELGQLKLEGKTLREVKDFISIQIIQQGYMKEPVVNVDMNNFKITVLKESGGSIIEAGNGPINLLQVMAEAGSAGERTKIKDIMVIRTENGYRTAYTVDLQKEALFDSPVFYLQQNDIVYIKPKGKRQSQTAAAWTSGFNYIFTIGTLISNYMIWKRLID